MSKRTYWLALLLFTCCLPAVADEVDADHDRDILVTFDNQGASAIGSGVNAPYRYRKRYSISSDARRSADEIASQYSLMEVDHWPIRSLSVYCFVYRVGSGQKRDDVIEQLRLDSRVESVQPLNEFDTGIDAEGNYNDTLVELQRGLDILGINEAHHYSQGSGVRIAIIDSDVDVKHEDLQGRVHRIGVFTDKGRESDLNHGTAIASVIGANADNGKGIVGVAPKARLELFVSCWSEVGAQSAVCDSFTLAKALDTLLENPPQILNLSLNGPDDALVKRLIEKAARAGVIIVAASPDSETAANSFPANMDQVIGVGSSEKRPLSSYMKLGSSEEREAIFAPGYQIMVAVPNDTYDFRSGSSLASAQVSGVIALLLSISPKLAPASVVQILRDSQAVNDSEQTSVNACVAINLASSAMDCIHVTKFSKR